MIIDNQRRASWIFFSGRRGEEGGNHGTWMAGGVGRTSAMQNVPDQLWHGKGPQWLSTGRTHLIHDLISHPVTNQHAGATTRDVRFKHFYPSANNKAVNVIDTDKGDSEYRFDFTSLLVPSLSLSSPTAETETTLGRKSIDLSSPPFAKVSGVISGILLTGKSERSTLIERSISWRTLQVWIKIKLRAIESSWRKNNVLVKSTSLWKCLHCFVFKWFLAFTNHSRRSTRWANFS